MLLVVCHLDLTTTIGLLDRLAHRIRHLIGIHDHRTAHIACSTSNGLDERSVRAQEAFLVGVEDRHERHLRQIQAFTQQIDAHDDVDLALTQFAQQFNASQRVDVGV